MTLQRITLFSTLVLALACGACGGSSDASAEPSTSAETTTEGGETSDESSPAPIVGADRDEHGCIGSAGYSWCEREHACVRPWELASQRGFEVSAESFAQYCSGS